MTGDHDELIRALANGTAEPAAAAEAYELARDPALDRELAILYSDALHTGGWLDKEVPFPMIPKSVRLQLQSCPSCYLLYGYLDETQINHRKPAAGIRAIARELGWHTETVGIHAQHLEDQRLIVREQIGRRQLVLRVVHNPARGRFAFLPTERVSGSSAHSCPEDPLTLSGDSVHRSGALSSLAQVSEASPRANGIEGDDFDDVWSPNGDSVENADEPLPWNWRPLDDEPPKKRRTTRRDDTPEDFAVLACIEEHLDGVGPAAVRRATGVVDAQVRLQRLERQERIVKLGKGLYGPVSMSLAAGD